MAISLLFCVHVLQAVAVQPLSVCYWGHNYHYYYYYFHNYYYYYSFFVEPSWPAGRPVSGSSVCFAPGSTQ